MNGYRPPLFHSLFWILVLSIACTGKKVEFEPHESIFNDGWEFILSGDTLPDILESAQWQPVKLPHTPVTEPLIVNDQWQGICWYKKRFYPGRSLEDKNIFLRFEGAMQVADVWINGIKKTTHMGGFLPFTVDITREFLPGDTNEVLVRLNNRDNPITGPKPLKLLDFNMYGGLYRDVFLIIKNKVYITDPVNEGLEAGGGIFVRFPEADREKAIVSVQTHVRNSDGQNARFRITHELWIKGVKKIEMDSAGLTLPPESAAHFQMSFKIDSPALWSPQSPHLYLLVTRVTSGNRLLDADTTTIGIKHVVFENNQLLLNGQKTFLRGVNRHQEYPYIGYALSNQANYRDAVKIKEAGFDYVRLSHYPHAPSFMKACDEIGLLVIDAILGWQYYSDDPAFQSHIYQTCKDLIRRDRNHACVLAWEVSLNESWMPESFIDSLTAIAHREYPGNQCFTAGWQEYGYDIYLQARQHRLQHYSPPEKPYVVSEYGDWEYFAMNAGLDQDTWQDLKQEERSSRQLLSGDEIRLLQQATNVQEAHNDNFSTPAFADGYWVMFDYNRGYADDLEASGIMSINRLPKFSYYFFRSQRPPDELSGLYSSGPMVYIASFWNEKSDPEIRIFSNCEEVELMLNDSLIGRQSPDRSRISETLAFPPFTFSLGHFEPGSLKATGFIAGKGLTTDERITPEEPVALHLKVDESGLPPRAGWNDVVFVYATLIDRHGTVVPVSDRIVTFSLEGDGALISPEALVAEAGTAAALVRVGDSPGKITVKAGTDGLAGSSIEMNINRRKDDK